MSALFDWIQEHWKIVLLLALLIIAVVMMPDVFKKIFTVIANLLTSCANDAKNIKLP